MESLIVNELSLDGQFDNEEDFELNLQESCKILGLQHRLNLGLFFSFSIYYRQITHAANVALYLSTSRSDEARKFRSFLDQNFWDEDAKHSPDASYTCTYTSLTHGYSLAEACERQCNIYSFEHTNYIEKIIAISKNSEDFSLKNYTNLNDFINDNFEAIVDILWNQLNKDFRKTFELLIKIFAIKFNFSLINDYNYSDNFQDQLLNIPTTIRNKSIEQITKRLSLTREQANSNQSLNDEPIRGFARNVNLRRFYITRNLGRIHYSIKNEVIFFEELNTQHDAGMP
ncbi:MAG: hypothetical protein NC408_03310 [Candidatus Gastranaerophilales bacterium]|nr:hypothetical protein [Candidatus Gastranaerophilales bacterium]